MDAHVVYVVACVLAAVAGVLAALERSIVLALLCASVALVALGLSL